MNFPVLRVVLFSTLMLFAHSIYGQENNDCVNAVVICGDGDIAITPSGPGINDFAAGDDGCLQGEHQSGWYYFEIQGNAPAGLQLGFTLDPDAGSGQDYDFAVFGPDVPCNGLGSPIRCSFANIGCAFCPLTGMGMGETDVSESPAGNGFVAVLDVQPGEGYYLLIDNFSDNSTGFSLTWNGSAAPWLNCLECDADAGAVLVEEETSCPGSTVDFRAVQFHIAVGYTNLMLVADENGDFTNIIAGFTGSISSPDCAVYTIYSYNYQETDGVFIPVVGDNISDLNCGSSCCDIAQATISFTDTELPVFPDAPGNLMLSCSDTIPPLEDQEWTDNCDGNGTVAGTETSDGGQCSSDTIVRTWRYTDACGNTGTHEQLITITPPPQPVFTDLPADFNISCTDLPALSASGLDYTNNETGGCRIAGNAPPVRTDTLSVCGGTVTFTWTAASGCDNVISHVQTITVEPAPQATFIDPPDDLTGSCTEITPGVITELAYSNNETGSCAIGGMVPAVQTGSSNACGGALANVWSYTDDCDRTIEYTQNLTVTPGPLPFFIDPPADVTISCDETPPAPVNLSYENGVAGPCALAGQVSPAVFGGSDVCGGSLSYVWTLTDSCGRFIDYTQIITVTPAAAPAFVDLPADDTLACGEDFPPPTVLSYTNGSTGDCVIAGTTPAIVTTIGDDEVRYYWSFTPPCNGEPITYSQTIIRDEQYDVSLAPEQALICAGQSFDLADLTFTDGEGNQPPVTFHTGSPATPANELGSSVVSPTDSMVYYVQATNPFGCTAELPFTVLVNVPPVAGTDGGGPVCFELADSVDLLAYLSGGATAGGFWLDSDGSGVSLAEPHNVDLAGLTPGEYRFTYIAPAAAPCSNDTAVITLDLLPAITIQLLGASCSDDLNTYSVSFGGNGFSISATGGGTLSNTGGDQYQISGISVDSTVVITARNPVLAGCEMSFSITPPDCSCPDVNPPPGGGPAAVCDGAPNPTLTVSVAPGQTANWYATLTGGTPLLSGSLGFIPADSAPGTYQYFAETEVIVSGCTSFLRTPVSFQIVRNPVSTDAELTVCDTDQDGRARFDLTAAEPLLTNAAGITFRYFGSAAGAEGNGIGLPTDFTNTTPLEQEIFVRLENAAGCSTVATLRLRVNLPLDLMPAVQDESCLGAADGSVTVGAAAGAVFSLDSVVWTTDNSFSQLSAGDYTVYSENEPGCFSSQPFNVAPGLALAIDDLFVVCNPNGTPSDDADDFSTVSFTVSNSLALPGTFTVRNGADDLGIFAYGTPNSLAFPANGQALSLTFTDNLRGCTLLQAVPALTTCSDECAIEGQIGNIICDGMETSDPDDDTFRFEIMATGMNNSSSWISEADGSFNPYSTLISLGPFPIADGDLTLRITDVVDSGCQDTLIIPAPEPCSPVCDLAITELSLSCNNNGTVSQQNDDFYTVTINAGGGGGGLPDSFAVALDGVIIEVFAYATGGTFVIPANSSNPEIMIRDRDDPGCSVSEFIGPLVPCNEACEIRATVNLITCDDLGTGNDSGDDVFTFVLFLTGENISGQWTSTDGALSGDYGTAFFAGPYPISEGNQLITLTDQVNQECRTLIVAAAPPPCSFCEERVNAGPDMFLSCTNDGLVVPATSTAPGAYAWTRNGEFITDQLSFFADAPGNYVLTATYPGGCVATDSLVIESDTEIPVITQIEIIPERCEGENNGRIIIEEITGGQSPYGYQLNGQLVNTAGFFTRLEPGDYTVLVTDANGCETDTLITIEPGPDLKISEPLYLEIMQGDSGMIRVEVNVPETELRSIEWTPPDQLSCDTCLTTNIVAENSQNYILEVIHENGCIVSTSVYLLARQELDVYIPNVFSPNDDGNNDRFTVFTGPRVVEVESMSIFDRWGENVFTAANFPPNLPEAGWDGNLNGQPMNPQVLVYRVVTLLDDGTKAVFKGDFVLMR